MTHLSIHKDFMLNGRQFASNNDLLASARNIDLKLFSFLSDWFEDTSHMTVQTSGSTGTPKDIQLKKEYMVNSALATGAYFGLSAKTTVLLCLSADYIAGKMMVVRALVLGWHLDIVEPVSHPLKAVQKSYDFSAMVPLQVHNSIDELHQIKTLIIGGGVVSKELEHKIADVSTEVYATYGMTETVTHIAIKKLNQHLKSDKSFPSHYTILPGIKIHKDARDCLIIDAPRISDEKVVTNDVVNLVSETEFEWLGRYDSIINSGGIKLIPEQIEHKLSEIIEERFFVAGLADAVLGEKLVLLIEQNITSGDAIENHNCMEKIRKLTSLSKFETPKQVYFLDQFIETETKKINRLKTVEKLLTL